MKISTLLLGFMLITSMLMGQEELQLKMEEVQVTHGEKLELLPNIDLTLENRRVVGPFELFNEKGVQITAKFRLVDIRSSHKDKASNGYKLRIDYECTVGNEKTKARSQRDFTIDMEWKFEELQTFETKTNDGDYPVTIQFKGSLPKK